MSSEEIAKHDKAAYREALQQIAEVRLDHGYKMVMIAREVLGMGIERWGCVMDPESVEPEVCTMNGCPNGDDLLWHGATKESCKYWQRY